MESQWGSIEVYAKDFLRRQYEAWRWIEAALNTRLASVDLAVALRDGVALLSLAERIRPGKIPAARICWTPTTSNEKKSNIRLFLAFCEIIGIPEHRAFSVGDLYRSENMVNVVNTLHLVSALAERRGFVPVLEHYPAEELKFSEISLEKAVVHLNALPPTSRFWSGSADVLGEFEAQNVTSSPKTKSREHTGDRRSPAPSPSSPQARRTVAGSPASPLPGCAVPGCVPTRKNRRVTPVRVAEESPSPVRASPGTVAYRKHTAPTAAARRESHGQVEVASISPEPVRDLSSSHTSVHTAAHTATHSHAPAEERKEVRSIEEKQRERERSHAPSRRDSMRSNKIPPNSALHRITDLSASMPDMSAQPRRHEEHTSPTHLDTTATELSVPRSAHETGQRASVRMPFSPLDKRVAELAGRPGGPRAASPEPPSPTKIQADEQAAKERATRLKLAIQEFITTEESYLKDLDVIIKEYLDPLMQLLSPDETTQIFSNVLSVRALNGVLSARLSGKTEPTIKDLEEAFMSIHKQRNVYAYYVNHYPAAMRVLSEVQVREPVGNLLNTKQMEHNKLDLASFLIKPMQRILKYPLLFQAMLKEVDTTSPDHAVLVAAHEAAEAVGKDINTRQRALESEALLVQLERCIDDLPVSLLMPGRILLMRGDMEMWQQGKWHSRYFFMLNDMLLLVKGRGAVSLSRHDYSYKSHTMYRDLTITAPDPTMLPPGLDLPDDRLAVMKSPVETTYFALPTPNLATAFIRTMSRAISERQATDAARAVSPEGRRTWFQHYKGNQSPGSPGEPGETNAQRFRRQKSIKELAESSLAARDVHVRLRESRASSDLPMATDALIVDGLLWKQSGGFRKAWKRRYCTLTRTRLDMYQAKGTEAKGTITTGDMVICLPGKDPKRRFALDLICTHGKYCFAFDSQAEFDSWQQGFAAVVDRNQTEGKLMNMAPDAMQSDDEDSGDERNLSNMSSAVTTPNGSRVVTPTDGTPSRGLRGTVVLAPDELELLAAISKNPPAPKSNGNGALGVDAGARSPNKPGLSSLGVAPPPNARSRGITPTESANANATAGASTATQLSPVAESASGTSIAASSDKPSTLADTQPPMAAATAIGAVEPGTAKPEAVKPAAESTTATAATPAVVTTTSAPIGDKPRVDVDTLSIDPQASESGAAQSTPKGDQGTAAPATTAPPPKELRPLPVAPGNATTPTRDAPSKEPPAMDSLLMMPVATAVDGSASPPSQRSSRSPSRASRRMMRVPDGVTFEDVLAAGTEQERSQFNQAVTAPREYVFQAPLPKNAADIAMPRVLEVCIPQLIDLGLDERGIFRVSGSLSEIKKIKDRFAKGKKVNISDLLDQHLVAGLIKTYLREVTDPLIPASFDAPIAEAVAAADHLRVSALRQIMAALPPVRRTIHRDIMHLATLIVAQADVNQMTASNMATCLGPSLFMQYDMGVANAIFMTLLAHHAEVFPA